MLSNHCQTEPILHCLQSLPTSRYYINDRSWFHRCEHPTQCLPQSPLPFLPVLLCPPIGSSLYCAHSPTPQNIRLKDGLRGICPPVHALCLISPDCPTQESL